MPGSSPRVWGIPQNIECRTAPRRFIPTRVGNTRRRPGGPKMTPVHPHACGEYQPSRNWRSSLTGSSPRVWGILPAAAQKRLFQRFIPTRVGNTPHVPDRGCTGPVHPHACGEYHGRFFLPSGTTGSSPRVWGILHAVGLPVPAHRFIPTRVGNTLQEDARNNRLLAELQRATEPCVLQACSDDDKKGKELCKAAPSPRKKLPGRAVTLS